MQEADKKLTLRLEMSPDIMKGNLPPFMAKTLLPVHIGSGKSQTIRTLMSYVYRQVKPMLLSEVDPGKLYFTSKDGFFLPPNADLDAILSPTEPICLLSWQNFGEAKQTKL